MTNLWTLPPCSTMIAGDGPFVTTARWCCKVATGSAHTIITFQNKPERTMNFDHSIEPKAQTERGKHQTSLKHGTFWTCYYNTINGTKVKDGRFPGGNSFLGKCLLDSSSESSAGLNHYHIKLFGYWLNFCWFSPQDPAEEKKHIFPKENAPLWQLYNANIRPLSAH